jgi:hypothetical protein
MYTSRLREWARPQSKQRAICCAQHCRILTDRAEKKNQFAFDCIINLPISGSFAAGTSLIG